MAKQVSAAGKVAGNMVATADGARAFNINLEQGIGNVGELKEGNAGQNLQVIVVLKDDNSLSHAWAVCGRMNTVVHEIDASGLTITDDQLKGAIKLIVHDDRYHDVHYERSVELLSSSVDGPAAGAIYEIDVKVSGEAGEGGTPLLVPSSGTIGAGFDYQGKLSGQLMPEDEWLFNHK